MSEIRRSGVRLSTELRRTSVPGPASHGWIGNVQSLCVPLMPSRWFSIVSLLVPMSTTPNRSRSDDLDGFSAVTGRPGTDFAEQRCVVAPAGDESGADRQRLDHVGHAGR